MKLVFPGEPKAVQSFRFANIGGFMRKYQPKETVDWKNYIKILALQQAGPGFQPITVGVRLDSWKFIFPPLKSFKKPVKARIEAGQLLLKTTKPDLTDNLKKGVIDALKGTIFADDSLICIDGASFKAYGLEPRIEVEVYPIAEPDMWIEGGTTDPIPVEQQDYKQEDLFSVPGKGKLTPT